MIDMKEPTAWDYVKDSIGLVLTIIFIVGVAAVMVSNFILVPIGIISAFLK